MVDGLTKGSESDIAGNSTGKPPACNTPRLTSSARSRRCVWQKLISLQVLMMAIPGLSRKSAASKPPCRNRARCPNARRSLTPSQRWLRSSSGLLRLLILAGALSALVDRQVGRANHLFPFCGLVGNELAEIFRRSRNGRSAQLLELGDHSRILQRQIDFLVQDLDDFLWRSGRDAKAEERARLVTRDCFGNGRYIGQFVRALGSRHCQSAQLASFDVADRRR